MRGMRRRVYLPSELRRCLCARGDACRGGVSVPILVIDYICGAVWCVGSPPFKWICPAI